jgi:hypothetical protein
MALLVLLQAKPGTFRYVALFWHFNTWRTAAAGRISIG